MSESKDWPAGSISLVATQESIRGDTDRGRILLNIFEGVMKFVIGGAGAAPFVYIAFALGPK